MTFHLIAHRGNFKGPNELENTPLYVKTALARGFDAEIDVWFVDDRFYLGHDAPTTPVESSFLMIPGIWAHAKNEAAFERLLNKGIHCFWHENDRFTITSRGYVWTHLESEPSIKGIRLDFSPLAATETLFSSYKERYAGLCGDWLPTK